MVSAVAQPRLSYTGTSASAPTSRKSVHTTASQTLQSAAASLSQHCSAPAQQRSVSSARCQAAGMEGGISGALNASDGRTKVLFVCLGNICRSPAAEAVFRAAVERAGVADRFVIDSCGTGGGSSNWYLEGGYSYHEGDAADSRMTQVAAARGVRLISRSRPLVPADLQEFDVVVGMDQANLAAIKRAAEHWRGEDHVVPADYSSRLALMTDFLRDERWRRKYGSVPDPYYGGQLGFELVLDLLDDACDGLLHKLNQ